ncbi:TOBE domain-containing protein [Halalkalicoccus jeotgali]|uniref:Molybdenum-binding protein n=1 Tax=Halalkalicoccus jeotgali (strain DSM 18796 / CECT 7217 / JCM 14584 / KCTC 4019 / B3) TaxID=795797 RepID=D8J4D0_HALJB|nr:TOBE domain-containing protein [Halalkalicoccus jeotgali]ADJ13492.1 putative molybdenum-binding protein [Halalkalicoccus jeotgali B3]ELY33033.1 putative molybdenum-binding protein [Halalkalicoccus jeotgali B3]
MDEQDVRGSVEAGLIVGEETITDRDVELLRAIAEHGSIHAATNALERSYAHAQRRVVELEEALGPLVERQRGGSDGGGSSLTDGAHALLERFERLDTAAEGLVAVEQTVLSGRVIERDGELGVVECAPGRVRALVPPEEGPVAVAIRSDAVTLTPPAKTPDPTETSARNRFAGVVRAVERGETVARVRLDIGGETRLVALVTHASVERLGLEPGREVVASFKATATRATPTHPD